MTTLTTEQIADLAALGSELTTCALNIAFCGGDKEPALNRIAIAARRIAEIVLPQDLRYIP